MDNIINEYIRGQRRWGVGEKTRVARLRSFGHARRKYDGNWEKDAEDGTDRNEETGKA